MKNNEPHGVQPSEDTAPYVLFSIPIADRIVNVCLAIFLIFLRGDVSSCGGAHGPRPTKFYRWPVRRAACPQAAVYRQTPCLVIASQSADRGEFIDTLCKKAPRRGAFFCGSVISAFCQRSMRRRSGSAGPWRRTGPRRGPRSCRTGWSCRRSSCRHPSDRGS